MLPKLPSKAAPLLLLVLTGIWSAAVFLPLIYSLLFPNLVIVGAIRTLKNGSVVPKDAPEAVRDVVRSYGRLQHAIRVSAHYQASAEYKFGASHSSKETQYAYVALFERNSTPILLVVNLTDADEANPQLVVGESSFTLLIVNYSIPLAMLLAAILWFRRTRGTGEWHIRSGASQTE